jgi:transcription elongation factor S-II
MTAASASPATTIASPSPAKPVINSVTPSASTEDLNSKAPLSFDILNEKTRNACLKIIFDALAIDSEDDKGNVYERAKDVEAATFKLIGKGEVNGDYRSKMRSLSLNLKDKKNPSLRQGVVVGSIEAEKLVTMSPEEMASDEKKAEREALQMQNLFKAKAAAAQEAETDAFQCGKCHQRKCTYYQKQTRRYVRQLTIQPMDSYACPSLYSADEPMTTFVSCTNCLNKWK